MAEREAAQRQELAVSLVHMAEVVRDDSSVLQSLEGFDANGLAFLFKDRAPSTLKKHLSGWRRWLIFCRASGVQAGRPSCPDVLDFLEALAEGASSDRGARRSGAARGVIYALRFIAHKLLLEALDGILRGPVVISWLSAQKWQRRAPSEALPLPLFAVCELEQAALIGEEAADRFLVGCFLVMLWAGLRFSDAQRIDLSSILRAGGSLRGWCWRSKTCPTGFAWGCQLAGATGNDWAQQLGEALLDVHTESPDRDFLLGYEKGPMPYSTALAHFRRCLVKYTSLTVEDARKFTLHSLKTTLLTWGLQLQVGVEERAAQGHHRLRNSSGCVEKYRRDDVLPALRCQRSVIKAVRAGWVPCTALARGIVAVPEKDPGALLVQRCEPGEMESDTETEDEDDGSDASSMLAADCDELDTDSVQSDALSAASDAENEVLLEAGPWILNLVSGWYHRAVRREPSTRAAASEEAQYGKACRPGGELGDRYEVRTKDPGMEGFSPCHHSACFGCV